MSAWMSSRAATSMTSSTASLRVRCQATTLSRPYFLAISPRWPGASPDSQPPFRPDAPNPAKRASSTVIRSDGSAFFR